MGDQDRISPYNINRISSKQVMRNYKEKYQLGDYKSIQYQILQTNITRTVWQTVRRITNEILGVTGFKLMCVENLSKISQILPIFNENRLLWWSSTSSNPLKSTENFDFNLQKARIFSSKARITREDFKPY